MISRDLRELGMDFADWLEASSDVALPPGRTAAMIAQGHKQHVRRARRLPNVYPNFVALTDFTFVGWGGVTWRFVEIRKEISYPLAWFELARFI